MLTLYSIESMREGDDETTRMNVCRIFQILARKRDEKNCDVTEDDERDTENDTNHYNIVVTPVSYPGMGLVQRSARAPVRVPFVCNSGACATSVPHIALALVG